MQVIIKCPACSSDSSFFIQKNVFSGPFRCWKCKELYTVKVKDGNLEKCEPYTQEALDKAKTDRTAARKKKKEHTV
jgi:transposase-like protein